MAFSYLGILAIQHLAELQLLGYGAGAKTFFTFPQAPLGDFASMM
mgnify:FL=1